MILVQCSHCQTRFLVPDSWEGKRTKCPADGGVVEVRGGKTFGEADWARCKDPDLLVSYLAHDEHTSARKLRLFAVACCRRVWLLFCYGKSRRAVETAERYADGLASPQELLDARSLAWQAVRQYRDVNTRHGVPQVPVPALHAAASAADQDKKNLAYPARYALACYDFDKGVQANERLAQRRCLDCIFGNPFRRPFPLDPRLLRADDGLAVKLARAIYDEPAFPSGDLDATRLGVLADFLEEGGCRDAPLLRHLRKQRPHWRGCWGLDHILGLS